MDMLKDKPLKRSLLDRITFPFRRLRRIIRDNYYQLKYRCQRFARGYSDEDVFEFALNLREHIEKILREFIKCHNGFIGDEEEYERKLNDMLHHLEWMDEDKIHDAIYEKYNKYCKEYFEEADSIMVEHTDKFFALFKELFWSLWD